jgi:type III restriction enzyme
VRLTNGTRLVLEVKGQDSQKDRAKRSHLAEWVEAVNEHGGFGRWGADVSLSPSDLPDILGQHNRTTAGRFSS